MVAHYTLPAIVVDELRQSYYDWLGLAKGLILWHSSASIPPDSYKRVERLCGTLEAGTWMG